MEPIVLRSGCLKSKFGFCDGDLILHVINNLEDSDVDAKKCLEVGLEYDRRHENLPSWYHVVLVALVREHLLPLLPSGVVVHELHTSHNPLQAIKECWHYFSNDIEVKVDLQHVLFSILAHCGELSAHERLHWLKTLNTPKKIEKF